MLDVASGTRADALTIGPFRGSAEEWNTFGEPQQGWTAFHRYEWCGIIERVHRQRPCYLEARDPAGRLVGILPLVDMRSPIFGRYVISQPFVNYGGPLGTPDAVRGLTAEAVAIAARTKAKLLELRSRRELPIELPASHRKITVCLDMPEGGPDALMKQLKAKVRSQVKRPQKEGVEVRFGPDQVEPFYQVFAEHMRDLGTPVQSRRLFEEIRDAFGDSAWFGCAWLGGRPIAGGAGFQWGSEFEMTWASALGAYSRTSANMLLYWEFMARASERGLRVFNFGRCSPGSGTHRFKQQWGTRDEVLWWYQAGQTGATPSPNDAGASLATKVWMRLPMAITNRLGPAIVRGIP